MTLPMIDDPAARSLNLANAVCAAVYEGLRQFASGRPRLHHRAVVLRRGVAVGAVAGRVVELGRVLDLLLGEVDLDGLASRG